MGLFLIVFGKNSGNDDDDRSRCFNDSPSDRRWHRSNGPEGAAWGERSSRILFSSLLVLILFYLVVSLFLSYQLQVNVLLEKHKELRRKKSANSFRREGVTQVNQKAHVYWSWTGFNSSETAGAEQQPAANWKRRVASNRTDWGKGGEQHGSLTGAGGGGPSSF